jgi:tripartite-type tricarboxylate transporter receptor subunit TctC
MTLASRQRVRLFARRGNAHRESPVNPSGGAAMKRAEIDWWRVVGVCCFAWVVLPQGASAQNYPVKPVRLVVGFVPGGSTDLAGRFIAQKLGELFGQQVIVENRPGAGTAIANERVATAPPDGYTLLLMTASGAALSAARSDLPYDIDRDFVPVARGTSTTYVVMIHPSVPVRNIKSLIELARSRPGKMSYASEGVAASAHINGELFKSMAKLDMLHVPFRGGTESSTAVAAGHVDVGFPTLTASLPMAEVGKIRLLAVTSAKRSALKPEIPTVNESGLPGYDRSSWNGLMGPAAMPRDIVGQLQAAAEKILSHPQAREQLMKIGLEPNYLPGDQFGAYVRNEVAQIAKLMKAIAFVNK